jgi:hypothetical protein
LIDEAVGEVISPQPESNGVCIAVCIAGGAGALNVFNVLAVFAVFVCTGGGAG